MSVSVDPSPYVFPTAIDGRCPFGVMVISGNRPFRTTSLFHHESPRPTCYSRFLDDILRFPGSTYARLAPGERSVDSTGHPSVRDWLRGQFHIDQLSPERLSESRGSPLPLYQEIEQRPDNRRGCRSVSTLKVFVNI